MSEWLDIQQFDIADISDQNGNSITGINPIDLQPKIILVTNYTLIDENGDPITDKTGEEISMEGFVYA